MKRLVALPVLGAVTLAMLVSGIAVAHGSDAGVARVGVAQSGRLPAWTACTLSAPIGRTSVIAQATPGIAGGSITVEVKLRHSSGAVTTDGATVTPTFPTAGAGATVALVAKGTSLVLEGRIPVPSSATAGSATLAIAGTAGSSTFTCGLTAKITVPVCTISSVTAAATPAVPGGMLWVTVRAKHPNQTSTLTATATATIPPALATAPLALTQHGTWPFVTGSFAVAPGATVGAVATVVVTGTYTVASVSTAFTCSLNVPVRNVRHGHSG